MSDTLTFAQLIQRVREGDQEAATTLVRRYEPAIQRSARLRLNPRLRRVYDSVDLCQAVLGSFFAHVVDGRFELDTPEQLLKLLATMVRNKLSKVVRHERAERRDVRRTESGGVEEREVAARGINPSKQVEARELLQEVHRRLSSEERRLVELRGRGDNWAAIADEMGGTPEALRKQHTRALARVGAQLGLHEMEYV